MTEPALTGGEYRTLVEQAPIMIWRSDVTGSCDYFNERWLAFTGRTLEEEVGDGWATGVHPDDMEQCLRIYLTSFAAQRTFEMEYRLRRADGEYRWLFDRGVPFFGADGSFGGYIGSCIDITEQVLAREARRQATAERLKRLHGMLPICAWCKQVQDEEGYWSAVEVYIRRNSDLDFSHGMCPACERKLMPGGRVDVDAINAASL